MARIATGAMVTQQGWSKDLRLENKRSLTGHLWCFPGGVISISRFTVIAAPAQRPSSRRAIRSDFTEEAWVAGQDRTVRVANLGKETLWARAQWEMFRLPGTVSIEFWKFMKH